MPDFLGLGAQKAGSTWLYFMLRKHPGVFLPPVKELHFWDAHHGNGLDWYRGHFADAPRGLQKGEITPAYAILSYERIGEIRREFPDLRLVYLMRNPIERAWSGALMALTKAEMTPDEASDRWFIDHFRSAGSTARGNYEACLKAWLSIFPAEQMRWFLYDEVVADPRHVLVETARHIGVDPGFFAALPAADLTERHNEGPGAPIRPPLKAYLGRVYRAKIVSLQDYLKCDLSAWLRDADEAIAACPRGWIDRIRDRLVG
ncbi:MAG: sulfotransferase domain-containing protein [Alphaproteobacteria bacterium]|nr:sulfotransferase domain-containing protein [Alphaproteobacteria bacterium]MBU0797466.1 sulfotransferase domain-containing protein [Alphaproteobacteria bacterium]MBU0889225.1 sulfotransferase domain-containing protein [Alphaproteobacteria bacterium]MBU1813814.1 sulfotransferase domain-containing protein [Alphaproteobacteria bacterium]